MAHENQSGAYETFLERYHHAPNPQEEQRYLFALGGFGDEKVALDAAEKCFSSFRTQDGPSVLGLLTRNERTGPSVWRYLTGRWDEAMAKFPPSAQSRMALGLPTFIRDEAFANEVEGFHTAHPLGGEQRTVLQKIERMRVGQTFARAVRQQI